MSLEKHLAEPLRWVCVLTSMSFCTDISYSTSDGWLSITVANE